MNNSIKLLDAKWTPCFIILATDSTKKEIKEIIRFIKVSK